MIVALPAFRALVDRAARESWPLRRLVDELELLPPDEREQARALMVKEIVAAMVRHRPKQSECARHALARLMGA